MAIVPDKKQALTNLEALKGIRSLSSKINVNELIDENKNLESELHLTLEEIAHLQNAVANANMKLTAYQNSTTDKFVVEKKEFDVLSEALKEIYIPLNTISNYCDLLLSQTVGILGTLQQKFVERIGNSAVQIRGLLDNFQESTLVKDLSNQPDDNSSDLHTILEQILSRNSLLLQEKQIVLQMEVPEELPKLLGERDDLYTIIDALVMNALIITPKDGSLCISAINETNLATNMVKLKVRDGGPGIPAKELKKLFPFERDNSPTDVPGLAIKKDKLSLVIDLIQKQGCLFKITNAPNFGSLFEVSFNTNEK
jgi:signal transduction histidine kinase